MKRGRDWLTQSFVGRLIRYVSTSCYEEPETKHPESNADEAVDDLKVRETKLENLLQRVQDTKVRISELADISEPPPAKRVKIEVRRLEEPKGISYFGPEITISKPFLLEKRKDFYRTKVEESGRRVTRDAELKPMQHSSSASTVRDDLDKPVLATSTSSPQVKPPLTTIHCPLTPPETERPSQELLALPWEFKQTRHEVPIHGSPRSSSEAIPLPPPDLPSTAPAFTFQFGLRAGSATTAHCRPPTPMSYSEPSPPSFSRHVPLGFYQPSSLSFAQPTHFSQVAPSFGGQSVGAYEAHPSQGFQAASYQGSQRAYQTHRSIYSGFQQSPFTSSSNSRPLPVYLTARTPEVNSYGFIRQSVGQPLYPQYPPGVAFIVQQKAYDLKQSGPSFSQPSTPFVFSLARQT
jgi:hypothetical protein